MKKFIAIFFMLVLASTALAQDDFKAGILPDSSLYGLDKAFEKISLALTVDHANKAERRLQMASERIAELKAMIEKNKPEYTKQLTDDIEENINEAQKEKEKAQALGKDTINLSQHIAEMTSKHLTVLNTVLQKAPEQARENIQHAIEVSQKGHDTATQSVQRGSEDEEEKGQGKLRMLITDKPSDLDIISLEVTLSSIEVHKAGSDECEDEETCEDGASWFTIVEGPVTYDLIEIKDVEELLGEETLGSGKYTQIRLNVDSATLIIGEETLDITIPSEKIKLIKNFDIENGETTILTLDFDAQESVHQAGNKYLLNPTIKIIVEESDDEDQCTVDSDCDEGEFCKDNECEEIECDSNADCDDTNICTTDTCEDNECENEEIEDCCLANSDCDEGKICVSNLCVECDSDDDCETGKVCTNNVCQ